MGEGKAWDSPCSKDFNFCMTKTGSVSSSLCALAFSSIQELLAVTDVTRDRYVVESPSRTVRMGTQVSPVLGLKSSPPCFSLAQEIWNFFFAKQLSLIRKSSIYNRMR